jgi:hypothetical protein
MSEHGRIEKPKQERQDAQRDLLRTTEDDLLHTLNATQGDQRWLAIAKTHIEQGFMAWKRALYEGKRVGDP